MKSYEITGKLLSNNKKGNRTMEALDKQEIWNNPEDFGFSKIFKVEESRGVQRFNKRDF
jgi:hypothetical protein